MQINKKREAVNKPWLFVVYKLSATCFLGFPVIQGAFADGSLWLQFGKHKDKLHPLVMIKEQEWQGMTYIWGSPTRQHLLHPGEEATVGTANVIRALPTSEPDIMRRVGAKNAFWVLPRTWLLKFAEHTDAGVSNDDSLFELVWKLVQAILSTSDDETLQICSQRAYKPTTK